MKKVREFFVSLGNFSSFSLLFPPSLSVHMPGNIVGPSKTAGEM